MARLPRSIKIVVHDGRNLDYRVAGSKKTPQTRRWRVIFIGGEKKQATGIVDEQDGFPRWDCEVLIVTPKPTDAVSMLVVDGKERHVGQVIIPLAEIPPGPPPSLVTSQLHVRELEPTKHNSNPCGYLSFWIWIVDYWPEGTVAPPVKSLGHARSFRESLSHLGSTLKPHTPSRNEHGGGADSHSRLGAKIRDIKQRVGHKSPSSHVQRYTNSDDHSPAVENSREGSVVMGGSNRPPSIISSHPGLGPMGWAASEIATESNLNDAGSGCSPRRPAPPVPASYNPLAAPDEEEEENYPRNRTLERTPSLFSVNNTDGTHDFLPTAAVAADASSTTGANTGGKSRRRAVARHIRDRISKSTANLSELSHKIRSRRSSPDGCRVNQNSMVLLDERESSPNSAHPTMRPDTRPIVQQRHTTLEPNAKYGQPIGGGVSGFATPEVPPATTEPAVSQQQKMVHEEWGLPATQSGPTPLKAPVSYGLHPEENPAKSKEDMSKRELIELANLLEQRLRSTRTQLVHANMEQNQLHTQLDELNSELSEARTQLTDLRNRLLQDNMTQYLEVQASGSPEPFSVGRSDHLTTFSSPQTELRVNPPPAQLRSSQTRLDQMKALFKGGDSFGSPTNSAGGSFLSRAKALATKPFGGARAANGVAPNQPSLDSQATSPPMLRPLSPQSPRAIDYGSVW